MVGGYVHELVAVTANDCRDAAILRPEDVHRVGWMGESGQALCTLQKFHAHWNGPRKQVKWAVVHAEFDRSVALHPFLPRQAIVLSQVHPGARPNQRPSTEYRCSAQRLADVVR